MRRILTISIRAVGNSLHACRTLPKTTYLTMLVILLNIGYVGNVSAQCSNMTVSNLTPSWNGNEYCDNGSGYNPTAIGQPSINYSGTCSNTPRYDYTWERRENGGSWVTVVTQTNKLFVLGYDPPVQSNAVAGTPIKVIQWRLNVTDIANGNQMASSMNFTVSVGSQMTGASTPSAPTCSSGSNSSNGSINLTVNGGLTAKTYSWTATGGGGVVPGGQANVEDPTGLTSGNYNVVVTDGGCSSLSYNVTVPAASGSTSSGSTSVNACNSYMWNGSTYTTSGTYSATFTNAAGCDSVHTLNLTIGYSSANGNATVTACDSYTWNGSTYTTSGTYTFTSLNGTGCVNTATLALTVNYSSTNGGATVTACDSYSWNGATYTTSGIYTFTTVNGTGCVNTATLNLTINYSTTNGSSTVTTCDSYTWNGSTYTTSGTYTFTTTNVAGCVNTATLSLTVNYSSTTGNATITECDSYTWNGATYTASGTYTYTSLNGSGCVNTATLNLTINHSNTGSSTGGACDSYTWDNGVTYTTSGTYVYTFTNVAGCDSVHTLNLIIVLSNTGSSNVNACNSYTWEGTTYTASANPTFTYTNVDGCDSVHTLNLTIGYSNTGSSLAHGCNTYTWEGNTYTVSGAYTHTYTNANVSGCDSVHTLNLTIGNTNTGASSVTGCDSYTWEGTTYTASATPTHTYTNASGCDSVHTLNITVNYHSTSTIHINTNVSYFWPVTGQTYTTAGSYTGTYFPNAVGCDSIITLVIDTVFGVRVSANLLLDGPYDTATGLMHDSLRSLGQLPLIEPYTTMGFLALPVGQSGEITTPAVLSVTGNNAIVDWVYLELRDGAPSYTRVATKRALLQRDGDVVDVDGVSPVVFSTVLSGNYFVSVKHRNHLGVMTASSQALVLGGTSLNFTSLPLWVKPSIPTIVNTPAKSYSGVQVLWSGDARSDKNTKYNGLTNDKQFVLDALGGVANNVIPANYRPEDVNMDGVIKYNNTNADRLTILGTVGVSTPNNIYNQHTPN